MTKIKSRGSIASSAHPLLIIRPEKLRADTHQIFAEARDRNYVVFIARLSRTVDFELTGTLGAHGPKNYLYG